MNADPHSVLNVAELLSRFNPALKLEQFYQELMRENAKINLVSRETMRIDFDRMVAESLLPFEQIAGEFSKYLDIGSGGGIPSIPILLTQSITGSATLVERTRKKASALGRILDAVGCRAQVIPQTFEELDFSERFDLITLRFVKLTATLLRQILPLLQPSGAFVYYSSPEFPVSSVNSRVHAFAESGSSVVKSFTVFRTQ